MQQRDWIGGLASKVTPAMIQVLLLSLGLALIRVWRSWMFRVTYSIDGVAVLGMGARDLFSLGTILGTAACLAILWKARSLTRGVGLATGVALMTACAGGVIALAHMGEAAPVAAWIALIVFGAAGFSIVQASWVEWLGLHAIPLVTLLTCTIGWAMYAVVWTSVGSLGSDSLVQQVVLLAIPALSVGAMVLDAARDSGEGVRDLSQGRSRSQGAARSQGGLAPQASDGMALGPVGLAELRPNLFVIAWAWLFTVAYGVGTAYTGMGGSTAATMTGEMLAVLIVLLAFCVLGASFDYTTIYRFALVILAAGFVGAALDNSNLVAIQACFSASNVIIMALVTTFVCASARISHTSAAWSYGWLMLGWYTIALVTRRVLATTGFDPDAATVLFVAVATAVLMILAVAVWKGNDLLAQWRKTCLFDAEEAFATRCQELAARYGLSERETGVFVLLAQGKTYAEISESLFIAMGTVCAHANHIYEKVGVHSRQDLVELVASSGMEA